MSKQWIALEVKDVSGQHIWRGQDNAAYADCSYDIYLLSVNDFVSF